jgi:hypothetical protein
MNGTSPLTNEPKPAVVSAAETTELVLAIRFGRDSTREFVFELHIAKYNPIDDGESVNFTEKRIYEFTSGLEAHDLKYQTVPGWRCTLNDINGYIIRDSMINASSESNVLWWIDVCCEKMSPAVMWKYVSAFGLPTDSKFTNNFRMSSSGSSRSEKSRVYAGNGGSNSGTASSLSFFLHSISVVDLPIVHNIPAWMERGLKAFCTESSRGAIEQYYYSRFAFLYDVKEKRDARASVYEHADTLAKVGDFIIFSHLIRSAV